MKNILIIGIAIFVVIGGYLLYTAMQEREDAVLPDEEENGAVTVSGTVTAVDLEQMAADGPALITVEDEMGEIHTIAVPSMGLPLCEASERIAPVDAIVVGDRVSVGGVHEENQIVPCENAEHYLEVTGTVSDEMLGYEFTYSKGTYIRIEDIESEHTDFLSGLMLFNRAEYEEFQQSTDAREGPPAIHVRVYENSQKLSASVWAMRNQRESNIELAFGEPEEAVVGGANATHYVTDGLWPINTYVVAHGENVYVLMGMYPDQEAAIYDDFEALVDSFKFIPTSEQSEEEAVFCTMDAMMCPDGSYVGRVPPSCEFAACPAVQ